MTILWGLSYAALGGDDSHGPQVADAMARVLRERLVLRDGEGTIRLAPGDMPAFIGDDGTFDVPVAYIFEQVFGTAAILHAADSWTLADIRAAIADYVTFTSSHPSPLDPHVELHGWLQGLAAAGHLDAFVVELVGPAFEAERSDYLAANPAAVNAAHAWMTEHPFVPSHAVLPDDLVPVPATPAR